MNNWREQISQPRYGMVVEKDIHVETRDGARLALDVYRPDADGKFPALLAMGPFGKDEQGLKLPPQSLYRSHLWDGNLEAGDSAYFTARGYVHVIADIRGVGKSEGKSYGSHKTSDGRDGYDLIEWIAQQPWCNGNVGMTGYSYYGNVQMKVAIEQPPHLRAIMPSGVVIDAYRGQSYSGGVLGLFTYGLWDGRAGTSGWAQNGQLVSEMMDTLPPEELERRRQARLADPDIQHFPNLYFNLLYPHKNPNFFDIMLNPTDGPYWWDRSSYHSLDKIKVPVYIIGKAAHGFSKYWDLYNTIDVPRKITVKPTGPEERPWREDQEQIIRWYDHWLKGNDTGMMEEPPISLFVTGTNDWRYPEQWPLPGVGYRKLFLRGWEQLSFEPEVYTEEPDGFFQQPLHLSNKRDSVVYLSQPMPHDLEVIGPAAFYLYASIDQDDTNWFVSLSDIAPDGTASRVTGGSLKASHRAVDPAKSTPQAPWHPHTDPEPCTPGEIYEYAIELAPIANVFLKGHRIKLEIKSMVSPKDPEMVMHFHPVLCSSKATLHRIYRNQRYPSHLLLPVIER